MTYLLSVLNLKLSFGENALTPKTLDPSVSTYFVCPSIALTTA